MPEVIDVAGISVEVFRKPVKNLHLSVYPPNGDVRISAPRELDLETVRLFALAKIGWIRLSRSNLRSQAREPERDFVERESHQLWGRRYLLHVVEVDAAPRVLIERSRMELHVRPGASRVLRASVVAAWYREQLRVKAVPLIETWSQALGVEVEHLYVQQMKTRWGTCNPKARSIRLNTELVKKPLDCLEYVVVHELAHIVDPSHGKAFIELLDSHLPGWRGARDRLNQSPLSHVEWPGRPMIGPHMTGGVRQL